MNPISLGTVEDVLNVSFHAMLHVLRLAKHVTIIKYLRIEYLPYNYFKIGIFFSVSLFIFAIYLNKY